MSYVLFPSILWNSVSASFQEFHLIPCAFTPLAPGSSQDQTWYLVLASPCVTVMVARFDFHGGKMHLDHHPLFGKQHNT